MRNPLNRNSFALFLCLGFSVLAWVRPPAAHATLGEGPDSVDTDRGALGAVKKSSTPHAGFSVHEFSSPSSTIREYVSDAGVVFGFAWNGLTHPNLNLLLGAYSGDYEQGSRENPRIHGRRHHSVKTPRLVVEKWGHMRNLQGRAYAPSLLPQGVSPNEIK